MAANSGNRPVGNPHVLLSVSQSKGGSSKINAFHTADLCLAQKTGSAVARQTKRKRPMNKLSQFPQCTLTLVACLIMLVAFLICLPQLSFRLMRKLIGKTSALAARSWQAAFPSELAVPLLRPQAKL